MVNNDFRHELKFLVNPHQYHTLRHRLRHVLRPDPYGGPTGDYRVTTLYFDDVADPALYEKLSGLQNRQKVRVRIYGGTDAVIMVEQKTKNGDRVRKERLQIDRTLYEAMRAGDARALRRACKPLLDTVAWKTENLLLRPKVIVDYTREAYVHWLG